MFNVNASFYQFLAALQDRLRTEFDLDALSENACLLYSQEIPLRIIYYRCHAGGRAAVGHDGRCIHIDEDRWVVQSDLLLNRIAALAGRAKRIHARDCVAARIDKAVAMAFQQEHHLQVALPGKYRYGLFHNGELVAAAVFSGGRRLASRPPEHRSFELLRFCHKQGVHVVGGFSKLLGAFEDDFSPGDIMTYADKDWSDGNSYRKTGFAIVGELAPQVFWVDKRTMQRYHEGMLPAEIAVLSPRERERMGYVPVSNSGSIKLVREPQGTLFRDGREHKHED